MVIVPVGGNSRYSKIEVNNRAFFGDAASVESHVPATSDDSATLDEIAKAFETVFLPENRRG